MQTFIITGKDTPAQVETTLAELTASNGWINYAKETGTWNDLESLTEYFADVLFDLRNAKEAAKTLKIDWLPELEAAARMISSRLADLGAPFEVYHPAA